MTTLHVSKPSNGPVGDSAGDLLRYWRQTRRKSQMELAFDVGVSPKHISFVETGRCNPSRNLILEVCQALNLPLRQQNVLLKAGGFAPAFSEEAFDSGPMRVVREALTRMLDQHEPFPALVVNSRYDIIMTNRGYDRLVTVYAGERALQSYTNVFRLLFAGDGLRHAVQDWSTLKGFLLTRLWEEMISTQDQALIKLHADLSQDGNPAHPGLADGHLPFMTFTLDRDGRRTSFFTTITTLGTPLDLTVQELRLECLFPADEATKRQFPL